MLRFIDAANLVSLGGLAGAVSCALLAATGRIRYSIIALAISGLCDLFDGALARRLARSSEAKQFGAALDLVVDVCSFGMAPAVLLYSLGLQSPLEIALLVVFVWSAAWRLAYFDAVGMTVEQDVRYYHGLPTTYVALVIPLACLSGVFGRGALRIIAVLAAAILAMAMISPLRIRKPAGRTLLAFPVIGAVLILTYSFATFIP